MKVKRELLVVEAEGNAEDYSWITSFLRSFATNVEKQLNTLSNINFMLLLSDPDLGSKTEIDNDPLLKNCIEELEKLKSNYPHCAKLIQANKDLTALSQYNEDIQELDKELQGIKNSYGSFTFNLLQHLRQYVLQEFNSTKAISTAENSATVSTNAEASLERSYVLQKLRQHILQKSTIKLNSSDITTPILETSSKRKTTLNGKINNNLPFRKRKLQRNFEACTKPSSKLTIPNIPNKLTSILEIVHYWGRDMLL